MEQVSDSFSLTTAACRCTLAAHVNVLFIRNTHKEMNDKQKSDYKWAIKEEIQAVIDRDISIPFINSIIHDPIVSMRLTNAFILIRLSEKLIIEFDKNEISSGKDTKNIKEKNLYLGYLGKVFESSLILLGATDYIGSIVLLRSVLELLVGIATDKTGSMKERINSINFIESDEKETIYKFWRELCNWAHPYGEWLNNLCPKLYGIGRNYNPVVFEQCLNYSDHVIDLMLTITLKQFELAPRTYIDEYRKISSGNDFFKISNLKMFEKRLMTYP